MKGRPTREPAQSGRRRGAGASLIDMLLVVAAVFIFVVIAALFVFVLRVGI